ncbi:MULTISPECIES: hypothetical protein [Mesorhizobium]|uniref:Uncharacterized protein n=1 Tax=Mesorhizobium denitrificans TaxID=2294114 RepID=A0A371XI22_9HYPH|nr:MULTISPECIES: hypothetical protein [Mesorhizobium]RFC68878.1 hypothetical protein DY251_04435 [Mesorhizobium denitrificans]
MARAENPSLHPALRIFSAGVIIVLLVGAGLFFTPALVRPRWPWDVAPFNARFLGSFYTAEIAVMLFLLVWNRWSPGRLILFMAFTFTLVVTATSLVHHGMFNFARKAPWIWYAVYILSVIVSGYVLFASRSKPVVHGPRLAPSLLTWLNLEWMLLALYGAALLALPLQSTAFWPWHIDIFHAQTYSAIFLSGAAGVWLLARNGTREDFLVVATAEIMVGALAILGLVLTDLAVHRVTWAAPGTIAWIALFALIAASGIQKLLHARRMATIA